MRRLYLYWDSRNLEGPLGMIASNFPNGIICPGLQELIWEADSATLPFHRLFFSPRLSKFSLTYTSHAEDALSRIKPAILELDTFPLRNLHLEWCIPEEATRQMESIASSAVLRCGPTLETLSVLTPLSDAAVQHIMQLPVLVSWSTRSAPPKRSDLSLSDAFPQLEYLELYTEASLQWLPLFGTTLRRISSGQNSYDRGPIPKLILLECLAPTPVNSVFLSPIMLFHGLEELILESPCSAADGCAFNLTDDDVAKIASALPNLEYAAFGRVCRADSCKTTVSSLLFLSVGCKKLRSLEIHFNMGNLCDDLESISENPRLCDLCALSRCQLRSLGISEAPFRSTEEDYERLAAGFLFIFPDLRRIGGTSWNKLSSRLHNRE